MLLGQPVLVHEPDNLRELPVFSAVLPAVPPSAPPGEFSMDDIIYLVGLVVVVMAILSFFGLR